MVSNDVLCPMNKVEKTKETSELKQQHYFTNCKVQNALSAPKALYKC